MIFKVNGIHHEVDFPVLKLQFLGAQHIHASRGIWEARDSSVIQNVLCLGFDGPISKIFRKMMNMGYWCILSEAIHIYLFLFIAFLERCKNLAWDQNISEGVRDPERYRDDGRWQHLDKKDGYEFNIIQSNSRQTVHIDSSCDMSCTSLCKKTTFTSFNDGPGIWILSFLPDRGRSLDYDVRH